MNKERKDMKVYFYGNIGPLLMMILGPILGIIFIVNKSYNFGFFVFIASIPGAIVWKNYQLTASNAAAEEKYDTYVKEDIEDFKKRAIERLGIIQEEISIINPIEGIGPLLDYKPQQVQGNVFNLFAHNLHDLRFKVGVDKKIRYTLLQATVFFFSEEQIYVYQVDYDICSGEIFGDRTYEYFYRDIDCVITGKQLENINRKKDISKEYEYFSVIVTSGTSTKAISDTDKSILDNQVMGMRVLIRNKKQEMA